MEDVRGHKSYSKCTLWHSIQHLVHPTASYLQFQNQDQRSWFLLLDKAMKLTHFILKGLSFYHRDHSYIGGTHILWFLVHCGICEMQNIKNKEFLLLYSVNERIEIDNCILLFCFSEKNLLSNRGICKDKKSPKKCKKWKKKNKCNKKKVWKKCLKTCERCPGCPGNQVPNPNHPDECFCPGELVLDTNNPEQCVCPGNKIPDNSNYSHCICPDNQILDINDPFQCLCDNGQLPNMNRQCSKYINFSYDLQ